MKERGVLFSAPMVRALLDGTKTQTRRLCKAAKSHDDGEDYRGDIRIVSPYGQRGDLIWVKETWAAPHAFDPMPPRLIPAGTRFHFRATVDAGGLLWRSSIYMPRWASRITLEITDVRVERLQKISEADAVAEGWTKQPERSDDPQVHADAARDWYSELWESANGAGSWDANPWVWVVSFRRLVWTPYVTWRQPGDGVRRSA